MGSNPPAPTTISTGSTVWNQTNPAVVIDTQGSPTHLAVLLAWVGGAALVGWRKSRANS